MSKSIIQITSGRGPEECWRVVAKVEQLLMAEALKAGIAIKVLENTRGHLPGTLLSALLVAEGPDMALFAQSWKGTIQWISPSPFRKWHKRKNWFVGVEFFDSGKLVQWDPSKVKFETCRSSGPGGQNVNKVETAVRGTHIPSGIQVLASESRSQLQNKKLCLERLEAKVATWHMQTLLAAQQNRWQEHNELERGNPVRTFHSAL